MRASDLASGILCGDCYHLVSRRYDKKPVQRYWFVMSAAGGYFSIDEARREFKKYLDKLDSYYTKRQLFKMVKVKQDMRSPSLDTDLEG